MRARFWDVYQKSDLLSKGRTTHPTFFTHPLERLRSIGLFIEGKQASSSCRVRKRMGGSASQASRSNSSPHLPSTFAVLFPIEPI
jgi:hypothetical protein